MKFAHFSDLHLGAWNNDPDLKDMPIKALEKCIEKCMEEKVGFVVIAGDLFDTALPSIETVNECAKQLRKLKDRNIRIYVIPGSHDFSPTGKTMISVLENTGLIVNVCKMKENGECTELFMTHDSSGISLTGLLARRNALEAKYYSNLKVPEANGYSIFVLHSAIQEYMPSHLKSLSTAVSLSKLPKGFNYYANGHVHVHFEDAENKMFFPGPLFPASFDELEKYESGFFIVSAENEETNHKWISNKLFDVIKININADNKTSFVVQQEIEEKIEQEDVKEKLILIELKGTLESGKPSDINFKQVFSKAKERGAISLKKSISKLTTKEFQEVEISQESSEEIEKNIIKKHLGQNNIFENELDVITGLIRTMKDERQEEATLSYNERMLREAKNILGL